MLQSPDEATIVRSIIDLGRNLGVAVVAEGVEDAATWERLKELGCTAAQGNHLSRPVPACELRQWLLARSEALPEAANGSRTRDLELGKLALYQLSYRRAGVKVTYQAWSVPQCGQPTEVVTSALNT